MNVNHHNVKFVQGQKDQKGLPTSRHRLAMYINQMSLDAVTVPGQIDACVVWDQWIIVFIKSQTIHVTSNRN